MSERESSVGQAFPKEARLRKQADFDAIYQRKRTAVDDVLVVHAIANGRCLTRLGLSVSKKVGNAVVRNRWKRLIREAFRRQRAELPSGLDLVVRPRKGAVCEFVAIQRSLRRLTKRLAGKCLR